jgi:preprotein translocase subunit SecA
LVDPTYIGFDDVERELASGKDQVLARLAEDPHLRLVEDTVTEMEWWACFREEEPCSPKLSRYTPPTNRPLPPLPTAFAPFRRPAPKTGRNEPCPCGSGKKYKKCCGA